MRRKCIKKYFELNEDFIDKLVWVRKCTNSENHTFLLDGIGILGENAPIVRVKDKDIIQGIYLCYFKNDGRRCLNMIKLDEKRFSPNLLTIEVSERIFQKVEELSYDN